MELRDLELSECDETLESDFSETLRELDDDDCCDCAELGELSVLESELSLCDDRVLSVCGVTDEMLCGDCDDRDDPEERD